MFIPYRKLMPPLVVAVLLTSFGLGIYLPSRSPDYAAVEVVAHQGPYTKAGPGGLEYLNTGSANGPGVTAEPRVSAHAVMVIDVGTRTVLYAKNPRVRRAPASTTKIMTALIAIEKGKPDAIVGVSRKAASTPGSSLHLKAGDRLTMEALLTGLLLRSGNDAASAIAEHIAGDKRSFAALMNRRAREMGALRTSFVNPHGLDNKDHYTTAEDLALIALNAIENPAFARIVRTRQASVETEEAWKRDVSNTNRLLWTFDGAEGIKTGTTGNAGQCLVALASRMGRQVLTVVLGSGSRYWDSKVLLDYGFGGFTMVTGAERDEAIDSVPVAKGMRDRTTLVAARTTRFLVPTDRMDEINLELKLPSPLKAPLRKGQVIGRLVATVGMMEVSSTPLVVNESVPARTWWRVVLQWAGIWLKDVVGIFRLN